MLHSLSFMAQSRSVSAWDEQLSGPNGIQTRQLCYARLALGEAESGERFQGPLREVLVPQHLQAEWQSRFSGDRVQRGAKGGRERVLSD